MRLSENLISDQIGAEIDELSDELKIPSYTCPLIDDVIKEIRNVDKDIVYAKRRNLSMEELADAVEMTLSGTIDTLEKIRSANDTLRTLGIRWHKFAKRAMELASTLDEEKRQ